MQQIAWHSTNVTANLLLVHVYAASEVGFVIIFNVHVAATFRHQDMISKRVIVKRTN